MKALAEIGLKIPLAQREFCRYTGVSAEMERRGLGASRIENAWVCRWPESAADDCIRSDGEGAATGKR